MGRGSCGPGGPRGGRDAGRGRPAPCRAPGAAYLALLDKAAGSLHRGPRPPISGPFSPSRSASSGLRTTEQIGPRACAASRPPDLLITPEKGPVVVRRLSDRQRGGGEPQEANCQAERRPVLTLPALWRPLGPSPSCPRRSTAVPSPPGPPRGPMHAFTCRRPGPASRSRPGPPPRHCWPEHCPSLS